jgi:hypothetical protein
VGVGIAFIIAGSVIMALGISVMVKSTEIGKRLGERHRKWRHNSVFTLFTHNLDLIGSAVIVVGLAVAVLGGMRVVNILQAPAPM